MQRNTAALTRCTPSPLFPLPRGERETECERTQHDGATDLTPFALSLSKGKSKRLILVGFDRLNPND